MKLSSFCFCLKRDRDTYSLSSRNNDQTDANTITPTVTIAPVPSSSDIPVDASGSHYEKIMDLVGDKGTSVISDNRTSTTTSNDGGYAKITPVRSQQKPFVDDTELYATIDKTKKAKNRIRTDETITIDVTPRQGASSIPTTASSPQAIYSPSSRQSQLTITSDHQLPLPILPLQVHTNDQNNISNRHPHYDELITRESLQHRTQRLQLAEEQGQHDQQLRENYYSSAHSEQSARTNSDLYAEIAHGSASGTIYSNSQSHARPLNGNRVDDDSFDPYATVIETNKY